MRYLVLLIALAGIAHAHQSSTKYLDLQIDDDSITLALRFAPGDVTEPLKLRPDATPTVAQAAASPSVPLYVQRWIQIRGCTPQPATARADGDLVVATWTCGPTPDPITLDLVAFFALDSKMEMFVRTGGDESIRVVAAKPTLVIERSSARFPWEVIAFAILLGAIAGSWRAFAIDTAAFMVAVTIGVLSGITLPIPALVAAALILAGGEIAISKPRYPITLVALGLLQGAISSEGRGAPSNLIFTLPVILATAAVSYVVVRKRVPATYLGGAVAAVGVVWLLTCVLR
ncbi:MAG: hypothetical protein QM831_23340 [Kofleriaceae bacterium]